MKKIFVYSALAFVAGFGLISLAPPLGDQMQKVPLDKMAIAIEILK